MTSLTHNVKRRQATNLEPPVGDVLKFLESDTDNYLNYVKELTKFLTEPEERYDNIRVAKRDGGFTKVIFKSESTEVPLIYRNADLYIIGWMVGTTFYMEKDSHDKLEGNTNTEAALRKVIHQAEIKKIDTSFSYQKILLGRTIIEIHKLRQNLEMLRMIGDSSKSNDVIENNIAPFVILFAEAIRFPVIASAIQEAIRKYGGKLKLGRDVKPSNWVEEGGDEDDIIELNELTTIWGKLSRCVPTLRKKDICTEVPIKRLVDGYLQNIKVNINKIQLNDILGVANSHDIDKPITPTRRRAKRDAPIAFLQPSQQRHALLGQQEANLLDHDDNQQPFTASTAINPTRFRPDVVGALHLLTLGILYLSGGKLNFHHSGAGGGHTNPQEATAIATELTDRIVCFIKSTHTGLEDIGFDQEMEIQRQLSTALVRGDRIEGIVEELIAEYCFDRIDEDEVQTAAAMLSKAVKEDKCF